MQLIVILLLLASLTYPAISLDVRLELTRVDAHGNFTTLELLRRAALRSKARAAALFPKCPGGNSPVARVDVLFLASSQGEYLIELGIGTPPQPYTAILDTGSDLIWTQCKPCSQCIPQPTPVFDPNKSWTYARLPCSTKLCQTLPSYNCTAHQCTYLYQYADKTSTQGVLSTEIFTFGSAKKSKARLGFGCAYLNSGDLSNSSGIVGFGRAPQSLPSQLGVPRFAYCLTPWNETDKKSPLFFGWLANFFGKTTGPVQTTPLIRNPAPAYTSLYYVYLVGITVGTTRLPIPESTFAIRADGTGGVIFDSGTALIYIVDPAFSLLEKAFKSYLQLPIINDPGRYGFPADFCFQAPSRVTPESVPVPKLVLHFHGGANMDLPRNNYVLDYGDATQGFLCPLVRKSTSDSSIIGNIVQQNFQVLYDLQSNKLSWAPARCSQLWL